MNSIGFAGCHAAFAAPDRPIARPQAIAASFGFTYILSLPVILSSSSLSFALADLVLCEACPGHSSFSLKLRNFVLAEPVSAQNGAGVLAIERRA